MRTMRLHAPAPVESAPLRLEELPPPQPGPDLVRLRVLACGVCHTDLHTVEGDIHPPRFPLTIGHQAVGVIENPPLPPGEGRGEGNAAAPLETGAGDVGFPPPSPPGRGVGGEGVAGNPDGMPAWAKTGGNPDLHLPSSPGRGAGGEVIPNRSPAVALRGVGSPTADGTKLYGLPWLHSACGTCDFCRRGLENLCPSAQFSGFHTDGGYAGYLLARPEYLLPIPPGLSPAEAAPLLCAGIVGYRALRLADLQPGETLGLVGFGASAHLCLQVAKYWNCRVYVFTRSEGHRRHALDLGAAWAGGIADTPPTPLDRAVIFAPSGDLVPATLEKLRPGGTLAVNAIHMSPITAMPYATIYGERTLRSVANATRRDGLEFLELAARIPIRPTVSLYPLQDANRALLYLKHSRLNGEAVLVVE